LSESFITIAILFFELLEKVRTTGKNAEKPENKSMVMPKGETSIIYIKTNWF